MNEPHNLPTRDLDEALTAAGGNTQLAEELFAMLHQGLEARMEEIRTLAARADLKGLHNAAHRLHGATHYCGVPALRHAVRELERASAAREPVDAALNAVEGAVRAVMEWRG